MPDTAFPALHAALGPPPKALSFPGVIICNTCQDRPCWCCDMCGAVLSICEHGNPRTTPRDEFETCSLSTQEHAEQLHRTFQDGYAAGRASRGGILDPCPGSGKPPSRVTTRQSSAFGYPYRGLCSACGREYTLNDLGSIVRKHRKATV